MENNDSPEKPVQILPEPEEIPCNDQDQTLLPADADPVKPVEISQEQLIASIRQEEPEEP